MKAITANYDLLKKAEAKVTEIFSIIPNRSATIPSDENEVNKIVEILHAGCPLTMVEPIMDDPFATGFRKMRNGWLQNLLKTRFFLPHDFVELDDDFDFEGAFNEISELNEL